MEEKPFLYFKENRYECYFHEAAARSRRAFRPSDKTLESQDEAVHLHRAQRQDAIRTEATRCGMFYVNERWLGGMLTNFRTIQSRIKRMKDIETMAEDGTFEALPKKEVLKLKKEHEKLEKNLGGIRDMKKLPEAIFIVDPKKERICVQEAHSLNIPLIGICDTNCDPEELSYVIPGNDDAIRAVKLIVSKMADAVVEANQGQMMDAAEEEVPTEGYTAYPDEEA